MNTQLKAKLEKAIQSFIDSNCESPNWPDEGLCEPCLASYMADAAEVVFNAAYESSRFTIRENRCE